MRRGRFPRERTSQKRVLGVPALAMPSDVPPLVESQELEGDFTMTPQELARGMVRVHRGELGWYVTLADHPRNEKTAREQILDCGEFEREARFMARSIRRAIVDAILEWSLPRQCETGGVRWSSLELAYEVRRRVLLDLGVKGACPKCRGNRAFARSDDRFSSRNAVERVGSPEFREEAKARRNALEKLAGRPQVAVTAQRHVPGVFVRQCGGLPVASRRTGRGRSTGEEHASRR